MDNKGDGGFTEGMLFLSFFFNKEDIKSSPGYSCGMDFPILTELEGLLKLYIYRPWCESVLMHI